MATALHTAVWVDDLDATLDFYRRVLGLVDAREKRSGDEQNVFLQDAAGMEVQFKHDPAHPVTGDRSLMDHLAFEVDDLESVLDTAREAGSDLVDGPRTGRGGAARVAYVTDPTGYAVELIEFQE